MHLKRMHLIVPIRFSGSLGAVLCGTASCTAHVNSARTQLLVPVLACAQEQQASPRWLASNKAGGEGQGGTFSPCEEWMSQALIPAQSNILSTTCGSWLMIGGLRWC